MRDADMRAAVRRRLAIRHAGDDNTLVEEEMGIWSASVRIDIAVTNDELRDVELKSDRDTLDMQPLEADLYGRVFDKLELVVGAKHLEKALKLLPPWWSVTVVTQHGSELALQV
jgi:hypothetical protein